MTSILRPKQKPLDLRFKHSETTEIRSNVGTKGGFEPPRPLAAIHRDAKRANSPATDVANSPQPKAANSPQHGPRRNSPPLPLAPTTV